MTLKILQSDRQPESCSRCVKQKETSSQIETESVQWGNHYEATGVWYPHVKKELAAGGRELENAEFTFQLEKRTTVIPETWDVIDTATNDINGDVYMDPVNFTLAHAGKTHRYRIREIDSGEPGMTCDPLIVPVDVVIRDLNNGNLLVTADYPADFIFNNSCEAAGSWTAEVTKTLEAGGRTLKSGDFSFQLEKLVSEAPEQWDATSSAANDEVGGISFDPIYYTEEDIWKTFTYRIWEIPGLETGMTYDLMKVTVEVSISDAGGGMLEVTPAYSTDTEFNNIYEADGYWIPQITKVLSAGGRILTDAEFSFQLEKRTSEAPETWDVISSATNEIDGSIIWHSVVDYTEADIGQTYTYRVTEIAGTESGITYDPLIIPYEVTVADLGGGELSAVATEPPDTEFNNSYKAAGSWVPEVTKVLTGRALLAGEFEFELIDAANHVLQTMKNGSFSNIFYDTSVDTISLKVMDAGGGVLTVTPDANDKPIVFQNLWQTIPQTGEHSTPPYAGSLLLLGAGLILLLRRRRNHSV